MSLETHRHFHDELNEVKTRLLTMSGEAEAALSASVTVRPRARPSYNRSMNGTTR